MERLRRQLCSNIEVSYGTTEAGRLAIGGAERVPAVPHAVGTLVPWVEAQVLDDEGRVLPAGSRGLLRFRSDAFASGYLDDPDASAAVFHDGWYWPGDVGCILDDGCLVVEGRADDVINLGGTKIDPGEVEGVLMQDPSIADAAAYAAMGPQGLLRLLAAVVVREGYDEAQAMRRCRAVLGQKAPFRLVTLPALPRNSQGKLLRHELSARTRITPAAKRP
jgi:acyl-coenzyme A synthetase/AMP-(fatty) acid ligase